MSADIHQLRRRNRTHRIVIIPVTFYLHYRAARLYARRLAALAIAARFAALSVKR